MKKYIVRFLYTFFRRELDLRVKLFNVLAIVGTMICVAMGILSLVTHMPVSFLINLGTGAVSVGLLLYSARTGRYQICYTVSIICIFFLFFPSLFFSGGGYKGGMPFFFIFAVVFTVYMLEGWWMLAVVLAEVALYSGLCIVGYCYPQYVRPFSSEKALLADLLSGFLAVALALGGTLYAQLNLYKKQQRELVQAREDADSANQSKSAFLANMSHEIRTPIHIILGMNEIIRRANRNRQVEQCSEKIEEAGQMLLSLVNNVLDVSKIESGKMELLPEVYQTHELIDTLMLIGRNRCDKRAVSFRLEADPTLPPALLGDIARIRQIAANLLSNAAKYTERGHVTVRLGWETCPEDNRKVLLKLQVEDTGIGISDQLLPSIFDSFVCADLASHRHIEGTGLGLTIVKTLTTLMGGSVTAESVLGKGSTFSVCLPQQRVKGQTEAVGHSGKGFVAPKARILVVDDNEGNCDLIRALLADTHMQIDTVQSGEACLARMAKQNYHLILMDYMMPELDGLETLRRLKQLPGFSCPVVALTANAVAGTAEKLLKEGFSAFLAKPVPWSQMEQTLLSLLPSHLITITQETGTGSDGGIQAHLELAEELKPYGLDLESALDYFQGDLRRCGETAAILVKYAPDELYKARELTDQGNYRELRFLVHALKGKARNIGLNALSETAAHLEKLCTEGGEDEAACLMPYLFFLWRNGIRGLRLLIRESGARGDRDRPEYTPEECMERLPELLAQLCHRPSMECLDVLIEAEGEAAGLELLARARKAVRLFDFEHAEQLFNGYRTWKESGQV